MVSQINCFSDSKKEITLSHQLEKKETFPCIIQFASKISAEQQYNMTERKRYWLKQFECSSREQQI